MRLGVVSDIHAQAERLSEGLKLLKDCDVILCAGDISDQSRFDSRAVRLLSEHRAIPIKGNNDFAALNNPFIRKDVAGQPAQRWLDLLAEWPANRSLLIERLRVGIFHGSPWDEPGIDYFHYVFPEISRDIDRVASAGFDVVILGHTHRPMSVARNGTLIVNPGSCGCGSPPTCAVVNLASKEVEFRTLQ